MIPRFPMLATRWAKLNGAPPSTRPEGSRSQSISPNATMVNAMLPCSPGRAAGQGCRTPRHFPTRARAGVGWTTHEALHRRRRRLPVACSPWLPARAAAGSRTRAPSPRSATSGVRSGAARRRRGGRGCLALRERAPSRGRASRHRSGWSTSSDRARRSAPWCSRASTATSRRARVGARAGAPLAADASLFPDVSFDIVPLLNPWGWSRDVRYNRDGRDINRDFATFTTQEARVFRDLVAGTALRFLHRSPRGPLGEGVLRLPVRRPRHPADPRG